ncbi:MAG: type II toxin-antitoxin system RelE/ParE family toxin [Candidatus Aminicenantes bacterium]|nr:type II toxin-antitoxin system RelE/ParE family toxin [Candidatus Aminicenantes bacterium]
MKKTFAVIWSATAAKDLTGISEYIANDNSTIAYEKFLKIKKRAQSLYTFPERGRVVPELQEQGIDQYRELVIAPWRIIYRISKNNVYVLSVLDSRQNVEDILLKRLIEK